MSNFQNHEKKTTFFMLLTSGKDANDQATYRLNSQLNTIDKVLEKLTPSRLKTHFIAKKYCTEQKLFHCVCTLYVYIFINQFIPLGIG